MPNWFEPFPGLDARFPEPGEDARFPAPGTDTRFATPGIDAWFPEPGVDGRFGGAAVPPGAVPAAMTSPDVWPTTGSTVTITKGTQDGTPIGGVLTLAGADVTGDATDIGATLTYVVPAGGTAERTLTWTPESGAAVIMTVYPTIASLAHFDVSPDSAFTSDAGGVSQITADGTLAMPVPRIGTSANTVTHIAGEGFRYSFDEAGSGTGGRYHRKTSGMPATDFGGAIIIAAFKVLATPTTTVNLFRPDAAVSGGQSINVRVSAAGLVYLTHSNGSETISQRGSVVLAGDTVVIGFEMNAEDGTIRSIAFDGLVRDGAAYTPGLLRFNNLEFGNGLLGVIERISMFLREPGQPFGITLERAWERVANTERPQFAPDKIIPLLSAGQSLTLFGEATTPQINAAQDSLRTMAMMPAGLQAGGGGAIADLRGAAASGTNEGVAATGFAQPAQVAGQIPWIVGSMQTSAIYLGENILTAGMNTGVSGWSLADTDADPATGSGTLAGWTNLRHALHEIVRLAALEGRSSIDHPPFYFHQIAADGNMDKSAYETLLRDYIADVNTLYVTECGTDPNWIVAFGGGDQNTVSSLPILNSAQVQMELADEFGFQMQNDAPYALGSDKLHFSGSSQLLRSEAAAWRWGEGRQGRPIPNAIPSSIVRDGTTITVTVPRRSDLMLTQDAALYAGVGIDSWGGIEVSGATITGIDVAHDGSNAVMTITTSAPATQIKHCAQNQDVSSSGDFYPARRTQWRFASGIDSICVPGNELVMYLMPFSVSF